MTFPFCSLGRWYLVDDPSYRIFKSKPLPAFSETVRAQLLEHGQPELIRALRHEHIDRDEFFEILCEIEIDPLKRPEGDLAPCPMCQPNKFLHGRLCYFPRLECCAIIGHCCANKEHSADAERRYKEASVLKWQEDYFLAAMPLIEQKLTILNVAALKAAEAQRLHRKFRKDAHQLMKLLRDVVRGDGRLQVHFEVVRSASAGAGPKGPRGNRVFDTRDYGSLAGTVALRAQYNPVAEVEEMQALLQVWNVGTDENAIIDAISMMNERQRLRGYAVLTDIDHKRWPQFIRKLEDFASFFDRENLSRLAAWGCDAGNPTPVQVADRLSSGQRLIEISRMGTITRMMPKDQLLISVPEWSAVPKHR